MMDWVVPLATRLPDLLNPQSLTLELSILFVGLMGMFLWVGTRLRSVLILSLWGFLAMGFILTILWQISMVYFWLIALFNVLSIPIVIVSRGVFDVNL